MSQTKDSITSSFPTIQFVTSHLFFINHPRLLLCYSSHELIALRPPFIFSFAIHPWSPEMLFYHLFILCWWIHPLIHPCTLDDLFITKVAPRTFLLRWMYNITCDLSSLVYFHFIFHLLFPRDPLTANRRCCLTCLVSLTSIF